jgi:peptide/nickel transport system ATP-binding protein
MLTIKNLNVTYTAGRPHVIALRDINLNLSPGESLGIIGESGCGKTTLAHSIMGLIKKAAIKGEITFSDKSLTTMPENALRKIRWNSISIAFQNALEIFNPVLTVGEQIAEPMRTHLKMSEKKADARVKDLMEMTGLDASWRHQYPHQLSGGMRQRALIAMALGCDPDILIVDEPFSSLDAESRHAMVHLLHDLKERMGFAMILISHNMPAIQQLTTRLITLYAGSIVEQGRTADMLRTPLHPYTRGLINAVPEFFPYTDLWGIAGAPPAAGTLSGCLFRPRCVQQTELCKTERPVLRQTGIERKVACHKGGIETVLKARGIKKEYRLGKTCIKALDDVGITLRKGEMAALVGSSGSGKSTLAQILVNVLHADSGEVIFEGRPVKGRNATACMGGMQIIFQDPAEAVSHRLTVLDAVREPLDIIKWETRQARDKKAVEALLSVHLPASPDFLCRTCNALSGGQRQRLAVARALVTDPSVLIADEITAMLDPSTQATVIRELKGLQHKRGFSMIFITHDIHLARKTADRVYVLEQGKVVEQGAAFDIFNHPQNGHSHRLLQAAFDHDQSVV